jgi:serine protease Do
VIERHVKALAARVSPAVVAVQVGSGVGSGVVISADGLVLTAGHVCGRADRSARFTFPDGKTARGKTVGVNWDTDTGLLRITDRARWPHADMGDLVQARVGDWVLALGHPGGFDLRRSLVVRLGRMIRLEPDALQTDCTISPGDSGGPLFDMHGRVIGIHHAISRSPAENFHVAASAFYSGWDPPPEVTGDDQQPTRTRPEAGVTEVAVSSRLPRRRFRSGEATLRALTAVSEATRHSIVKLNLDGETVALGTVMDADGLVLTKASELKAGKLTCWLATDQEVRAEVIGVDEEEDLALVRVQARGLKPVQWSEGEVAIGQWAITPGIAPTPQAIGIISAMPRRIRYPRALIGVQFDYNSASPRIENILPGLGAEKAGLKPGDLIVAVNAAAVTNREQVVESLRDLREGQTVKLRVQRLETQFTAEVRMMVLRAGTDSPRRPSRLAVEVSQRAEGFEVAIEHDTVLPPWLCGGPLVNLDGRAIGLNIARASRVSTYALPARLAKRVCADLRLRSDAARRNRK